MGTTSHLNKRTALPMTKQSPTKSAPDTRTKQPSAELRTISLFSGAGGMDLGLEAVGFQSRFVTDIDLHSCRTLANGKALAKEKGKPFLEHAVVHKADVRELTAEAILSAAGLKAGEVDVVCGGPPCQAFSVFGKRMGRQDPRGTLVYEYLRLLRDLKPRAFVFENVYGLLTIEKGKVFQELCETLKDMGFTISAFRLNAADYGVPQFRDRVFILGSRDGKRVSDVSPLCAPSGMLPELGLARHRTVADALRGLPRIGAKTVQSHVGRNHSPRIVLRYGKMTPGERDKHTRINRLDLSKPSYTIIVGSDAGGGKGHVHPVEAREVTARESARIQTFPDWWGFSGTSRHPIRQVGNAVPPLLAAAIGNAIRTQLFDLDAIPFVEALGALDQMHLFQNEEGHSQMGATSTRRIYSRNLEA